MSNKQTTAESSVLRVLLALTALGLLVRVAYLFIEPSCALAGDEPTWIEHARQLKRPGGHFSPLEAGILYYAPLYPYFVGSLWWVFGKLSVTLWAQCLLNSTLVLSVGLVAWRCFGRQAGIVAGLVVALWPEFVWFSVHYWSESLFIPLLWCAIERTLVADEARSRRGAVLAGVFWGLATLAREMALYLWPIVIVWMLRPEAGEGVRRIRKGAPQVALALGLASVLTVLPWTVRNAVVHHAFIPVSTSGSLNIWLGNSHLTHIEIFDILETKGNGVEQDRYCREMARKEIAAQQPFWIFRKLRDQMPQFWTPGSEVVDHYYGRQACGPLRLQQVALIEALLIPPFLAVLAGFVLGLVRLRLGAGAWLLLVMLAAYNAAHVIAVGGPRYRLPMTPIVIIFAAALATQWRSGSLLPVRGWRAVVLALLTLLTLAVLVPGVLDSATWRVLAG